MPFLTWRQGNGKSSHALFNERWQGSISVILHVGTWITYVAKLPLPSCISLRLTDYFLRSRDDSRITLHFCESENLLLHLAAGLHKIDSLDYDKTGNNNITEVRSFQNASHILCQLPGKVGAVY